MNGFILVIHVITCLLLMVVILMQSGRGGGLTENFASAEAMFGAQTNVFMVRMTSVLAAVFFITSLALALFSSHQEKSLMANTKLLPKASTQAPLAQDQPAEPEVSVTVDNPVPVAVNPNTGEATQQLDPVQKP